MGIKRSKKWNDLTGSIKLNLKPSHYPRQKIGQKTGNMVKTTGQKTEKKIKVEKQANIQIKERKIG